MDRAFAPRVRLRAHAQYQWAAEHRREIDLCVYVDDVQEMREMMGPAEIVEDVHDTFDGMRELIIRDLNRFWINFGQVTPEV